MSDLHRAVIALVGKLTEVAEASDPDAVGEAKVVAIVELFAEEIIKETLRRHEVPLRHG